jgi:hypothetical protein
MESRGVDHELGHSVGDGSIYRLGVHHVDIGMSQAGDLRTGGLEGIDDVAAQLAGGAQDEDAFWADD